MSSKVEQAVPKTVDLVEGAAPEAPAKKRPPKLQLNQPAAKKTAFPAAKPAAIRAAVPAAKKPAAGKGGAK